MAGRPDTPEERQARQDAGTGNGDALQEAYDDLNDIEETAGIPPTPRAQARAARGSDARPGRRAATRDLLADDLDGLTVAESPAPANPYGRRDGAPNALVASAARIALNDRRAIENTRRRRQAWQSEAWDYFDEIGEIGYTDTFLANLMSKLRLYPAVRPDPKEAPMSVDDKKSGVDPSVAKLAIDTLARLKSVEGGQSAILRELSLNLEVAGECYLHGHMEPQDQPDPDEPPGPAVNGYPYVEPTEQTGGPDGPNPNDVEDWQIRSVDELVIVGDQFSLRRGPGVKVLDPIPPNDLVIRIWERHPRFSEMATCAMRRVLAEAEALLLLSREVRATSKSRLSNGILLIPSELSFGPIDQTRDSGDGEAADDPFDAELQEAMITPIQEEGSASAVVPLTLRGPAEYLQHVNHLALDKALDPVLDARIEQRIMRIARGLNLPVEVTTGLMSCLDMASEVLTERGWLSGYDLRVGDVVLTLNHETGQSEWQPVERVSIYPAVDHPMLRMDRKSHSSLSTLNHRWPIIVGQTACERRWRQSDTLTTNSRLVTAAPSADLPTDAKYSDALVETVAWFYTEGWIDRRGYSDGGLGVITQDARIHPGHVDRIRSALTTLFGPAAETLKHTGPSRWWGDNRQRSWVPTDTPTRRVCYRCGVNDARNRGGKPVCEECSCLPKDYRTPSSPDRPQRQVVAWTETRDKNRPMARFRLSHAAVAVLEQAAPDRIPTSEFVRSLTAGQLELFLNVSRWADGWTVNSGTQMFSQSDARRVDAYELAVILSGRTPSRWNNYDRANDHIQHFCSVTDRTTVQPFSRSAPADTVTYTGDVWCPTTPNQTWLAKRDGRVYFTGNTTFANAAQVKRSEFEDHIEPRAILVCDAITSGYLQWALEQSGVDQELARTIFVWFDPSAVVASPDPAEQAAAAHKDMLISDQAYRRYLGYSEDDAPSDDEKLLRLVLNAPRMDPSILGQILVESKLFPGLKIPGPPAGVLGDPDPVSASPAPGAPPAPPAPPPPKELPPGTPPEKPAEGTAPKAATGTPPPPVAAAGTPNEWAQLGRNLSALDQMLRVRIIAKLDEAMHTTLERAGNRVRTRIGRDRGALRKVESVAPKDLPAALGRPVVESTGLSETELLEGSFAQAVSDIGRWIDGAHQAALRAVERAGGPIPAAARQQAAQDHTAALAAASDWLTANLRTLAAQRIYNTKPDVAPGENDGTVSIPAGLVRASMAVAGGTSPHGGSIVGGDGVTAATWQDIAGNTAVTDSGGGPVGGVGTGPTVMGVVHSLGGRTQMYQWEYGQGVRSEFEPHHDLDGQTAPQPSGFQWPSSYDGWPENDTPFPGDHDGCVCDLTPILVGPSGDVTTEEPGDADYSDDDLDDTGDTSDESTEPDTGGEVPSADDGGEYVASTLSPEAYADQAGFERMTATVTEDDIRAAAAALPDVRAEVRQAAQTIYQDNQRWINSASVDAGHMLRPEKGADGSEWLYETLGGQERERLRVNGWLVVGDPNASTWDEVADRFARASGAEELNAEEIMGKWVTMTRLIDASKAMANGRTINPDLYGGLTYNEIIDSRYDLNVLFGGRADRRGRDATPEHPEQKRISKGNLGTETAARMVAETNAAAKADDALEILGRSTHGPAPWEMTEAEYLTEIENLEVETASIRPEYEDDEFGPSYTPADQALLSRVGELLPPGLDDGTQTYDQMYREIVQVAREGGLI